jgi:transglutaminase-like putative cysteine protease
VLPRHAPPRQRVTARLVEVSPEPDDRRDSTDFFGNAVTSIRQFDPHLEMIIRMACRVETGPPAPWVDGGLLLDPLRRELANHRDLSPVSPLHFLGPSPRLKPNSEIARFALDVSDPGQSVVRTVIAVGEALHDAMTFDATATTVDTNPADAFRLRRGVCQDMTHIMILALQSLGIPAGYVSGFLRTLPPPGGVRLEGVDAMHAWVRAWCGAAQGWIEYDPTNATLVGADHVVVAYGRDYSDVSPVVGHLRSSGPQVNSQSVDVAPVVAP